MIRRIFNWKNQQSLIILSETTRIYARATDDMKRQAQRKLEENGDSVFKDYVTFKYADDDETLRRLSGLK